MQKFLGIKSQPQTFLSARRFNKIVEKHNANCLAFAFGQTTANLESFDLITMEQIEKLTHPFLDDIFGQTKKSSIDLNDFCIKSVVQTDSLLEPIAGIEPATY